MSTFANSFALLEADAAAAKPASHKKKKSKKSKKSATGALPPSGANGGVAVDQAPEDQAADDYGFQLAGKSSRRSSIGSQKAASSVETTKQRSLAEGISDLELEASRVPTKESAERVTLWTSWQQQCADTESEDFSEGPEQHGFKQALLTSEALEITVQRCLVSPFPSTADLAALAHLLSAVLPQTASPSAVQALLHALQDLIKALPGSSSSSSVATQAQQAVSAVVAWLKSPQPVPESISSAQSASSDVVEQAASLSDEIDVLQSSIPNVSNTRDRLSTVQQAARLCVQQLQLFQQQTDSSVPKGKLGDAFRALDSLVDQLVKLQDQPRHAAGGAKQAGLDTAAQQLAQVRSQINDLERKLGALRQQERELDSQQCSEPQKKQQQSQDVQANGIQPSGSTKQLASLRALKEALVSSQAPSKTATQRELFQAQEPNGHSEAPDIHSLHEKAVGPYLELHQQLLYDSHDATSELIDKVKTVTAKLQKAVKTGRDLMLLNMKKEDIATNQQHQLSYQKQITDLVGAADDILQTARCHHDDLIRRQQQLARASDASSVQSSLAESEHSYAKVQEAYDAVVAVSKGQDPTPRGTAAVSLSHADPVVQPLTSHAGAIGTSSTSGTDKQTGQARLDGAGKQATASQQTQSFPAQRTESKTLDMNGSAHDHGQTSPGFDAESQLGNNGNSDFQTAGRRNRRHG